jgi:hypothetical protein
VLGHGRIASAALLGSGLGSGLGSVLGCGLSPTRIPAAELLRYYQADDLAGIESLMPNRRRVRLVDVVFHDWAYPDPERIDATQDEPGVWREATRVDHQGGPVHHGVKLRIGDHDPAQVDRSGPKVIAFVPDSNRHAIGVLKQAYLDRAPLVCMVSWIGVLRAPVWADSQVAEDDMVGLRLHGVSVA